MKPPVKVVVQPEPPEDRRQPGTKAQRSSRKPLEIKVKFWQLMIALVITASGVGVAIRNTDKLSAQAHTLHVQADQIAVLATANRAVLLRVAADEHATCVIQARGLPASHYLAAAMNDIHRLLGLPQTPAQVARTPPAVIAIVADLNMNLAAYQKLEAKQPATRTC